MTKSEMVECLVNYYDDGNKSKFGRRIGVTDGTIGNWIRRNTFDAEIIFAKCEGISAQWLLSHGKGSMLEKKGDIPAYAKEELMKLRVENALLREVVGLKKKEESTSAAS